MIYCLYSCDIHCTDEDGTTPLHWAAIANRPDVIELLLRLEFVTLL